MWACLNATHIANYESYVTTFCPLFWCFFFVFFVFCWIVGLFSLVLQHCTNTLLLLLTCVFFCVHPHVSNGSKKQNGHAGRHLLCLFCSFPPCWCCCSPHWSVGAFPFFFLAQIRNFLVEDGAHGKQTVFVLVLYGRYGVRFLLSQIVDWCVFVCSCLLWTSLRFIHERQLIKGRTPPQS